MNKLFTNEEINIIINSLNKDDKQEVISKINLLKNDYIEIKINNFLSWEDLRVEPYPLTKLELTKDYFNNKILQIFKKYTDKSGCSGDESECFLGKILNEHIYFYIIDDPGATGYDCCGSIELYYSDSLKIIQENMEYIKEETLMISNYID